MLRVADHAARTDTGRARSANEDSYWVRSPLFVLRYHLAGLLLRAGACVEPDFAYESPPSWRPIPAKWTSRGGRS